jgi:hypothetical protein
MACHEGQPKPPRTFSAGSGDKSRKRRKIQGGARHGSNHHGHKGSSAINPIRPRIPSHPTCGATVLRPLPRCLADAWSALHAAAEGRNPLLLSPCRRFRPGPARTSPPPAQGTPPVHRGDGGKRFDVERFSALPLVARDVLRTSAGGGNALNSTHSRRRLSGWSLQLKERERQIWGERSRKRNRRHPQSGGPRRRKATANGFRRGTGSSEWCGAESNHAYGFVQYCLSLLVAAKALNSTTRRREASVRILNCSAFPSLLRNAATL